MPSITKPDRTGTAMVEFALILPVAMMLVMGTVEIGWAWFNLSALRHACEVGGREASLGEGTSAVQQLVRQRMHGLPVGQVDVMVYDAGGQMRPSTDRTPGHVVRVQAALTFQSLTGLPRFFPAFGDALTGLSARADVLIERRRSGA